MGSSSSKSCTTATDCGTNQVCPAGVCASNTAKVCSKKSDCASSENCQNGVCVTDSSTNWLIAVIVLVILLLSCCASTSWFGFRSCK